MVFDPVTATGLAGNIVQFVQFASDIISKFREIYSSTAGAARETIDLVTLAENDIALQLRTSLRPPGIVSALNKEDQQLEDVRVQCREIATELLEALDMLKVKGTPGKWKSFNKALKTVWEEKKLEAMGERLAVFNNLLTRHIVIDTRHKLSGMASELTRFSDIQRESIDTAVNTVGMQIEALTEGQDALVEGLYRRTSEYSSGQHTVTRNTVNSVALNIQKTGKTLQQQVHADLNSILAEVRREVQGLHSKLDDAVAQKPLATERSVANHQISEQGFSHGELLGAKLAISASQQNHIKNRNEEVYNIDITAVQRAISPCTESCSCICHSSRRITFPTFIGPLLGFLSVTVSGPLTGYNRCSETSCLRRSILRTHISYRFPHWFLARILRLSLGVYPGEGPVGSLRVNRVVADEAEIMDFVKSGNLEGVKTLFQKRVASPHDVNFSCDVPILSYAVQGHHTDLCRFLLQNGANPCVENRLSTSALDRVWHMVLTRAIDPPTANAFREIFSLWFDSIWFEEQQFLPLHKIILGIVDRDLASELRLTTSSIDKPDAKGRTPIAWAAARGDDKALRTLLEFGANPKLTCISGNSPLLCAMSARSPACILPLLQHGVSVGSKSSLKFTALHYAAYYKDDGDYLTPLLDFGAEIDEKDSYGWTALACTAERNNSKSARLLLNRGADIESRDDAGWTPLLRSVNCNSHDVLLLLLRRGASYQATSSTGESILHFAAARGDCKTFGILAEESLEYLDIDAMNIDGMTAEEIMSQRTFKPPDLTQAFHNLLKTVAGTMSRPIQRDSNDLSALNHGIFEAEMFVDALEHQEGEESVPKV